MNADEAWNQLCGAAFKLALEDSTVLTDWNILLWRKWFLRGFEAGVLAGRARDARGRFAKGLNNLAGNATTSKEGKQRRSSDEQSYWPR